MLALRLCTMSLCMRSFFLFFSSFLSLSAILLFSSFLLHLFFIFIFIFHPFITLISSCLFALCCLLLPSDFPMFAVIS